MGKDPIADHAKRGHLSRLTYRICRQDHNNWNRWSL